MSKRIPIEFYNHLRSVREAKDRLGAMFSRSPVGTPSKKAAAEEYTRALNAYATAIAFRDILEREQLAQDPDNAPCMRTLAIVRPGFPMAGVGHSFAYRGAVPNTGSLICHLCGKVKEETER